jgi:hypothetical protein
MYDYGNCINVSSAKEHLTTSDCGILTSFEQQSYQAQMIKDQVLQNWNM